MDTIWDSSAYFCHYRGESGRMEAFYILKKVFNGMNRGGGGGVM